MFLILTLAALGILALLVIAPIGAAALSSSADFPILFLAALTSYRLIKATKNGKFGKIIRAEKPRTWKWYMGAGWAMVAVMIGEFIYAACYR